MADRQNPIVSQDGSHTLYSDIHKAHYHSVFGALEESIHVFIIAGLYNLINKGYKHIRIFEMGLGTGLNAYLSWLECRKYDISIDYTAVESHPVDISSVEKLNYAEILNKEQLDFEKLHTCDWNKKLTLDDNFSIHKVHGSIEDMQFQEGSFDLIYWDAFAPSCQSFLWEEPIHSKIYNALDQYGVLVSYCSQGNFRRMLESVGYKTERLNGPGKKRQMIRAIKS